jgi:hypothetical protein
MAAVRADVAAADRLALVRLLLAARAHVNYRQRAFTPTGGHHRVHAVVAAAAQQPSAPRAQAAGRRADGAPTALCIAAARGDADVCRVLVEAGAHMAAACNPHAHLLATVSSSSSTPAGTTTKANDTLLTPTDFARRGGHTTVVTLLLQQQQQQRRDVKTATTAAPLAPIKATRT